MGGPYDILCAHSSGMASAETLCCPQRLGDARTSWDLGILGVSFVILGSRNRLLYFCFSLKGSRAHVDFNSPGPQAGQGHNLIVTLRLQTAAPQPSPRILEGQRTSQTLFWTISLLPNSLCSCFLLRFLGQHRKMGSLFYWFPLISTRYQPRANKRPSMEGCWGSELKENRAHRRLCCVTHPSQEHLVFISLCVS